MSEKQEKMYQSALDSTKRSLAMVTQLGVLTGRTEEQLAADIVRVANEAGGLAEKQAISIMAKAFVKSYLKKG